MRLHRQHRMVIGAATLALFSSVVVGFGAARADVPEGTTYSEAYFPSGDGTILHADILRPTPAVQAGTKTPVVLEVGPYEGHASILVGDGTPSTTSPSGQAPPPSDGATASLIMKQIDGFARGFSEVVVDLRGYGASEGCADFSGPGEQADVKAAVEWAASQSWSTGKVALVGDSYDGATGLMGLATSPAGLVAVAAFSPYVAAYRAVFTNGVLGVTGTEVATLYKGIEAEPGSISDDSTYQQHWLADEQPRCATTYFPKHLDPNPSTRFWRARDLVDRAARSDVPVMWNQGFEDVNVSADNLTALYPRLRNPRGLWVGEYSHEAPNGRDGFWAQTGRFLDRYLTGAASTVTDPAVVVQQNDGRWRAEDTWPAADSESFAMHLHPGSYVDAGPNASGDDVVAPGGLFPMSNAPVKGRGAWTFTQPLPYEVHLSGAPQLRLDASGPANARMIPLLYDVDPAGQAHFITRTATVLRNGSVNVDLFPQDWVIAAGHRLGLLLTNEDESFWTPESPGTGATVAFAGGTLFVPALRNARTEFLDGSIGTTFPQVDHPIQVDDATIANNTTPADLPPENSNASAKHGQR